MDLTRLLVEPINQIEAKNEWWGDGHLSTMKRVATIIQNKMNQTDLTSLKMGYVHGDSGLVNLMEGEDKKIWFIDFDFSGYGWLVYDVATFIASAEVLGGPKHDPWLESAKLDDKNIADFINGYESRIKLSEAEKSLLPYLKAAHWIHLAGEAYNTIRSIDEKTESFKGFIRRISEYLDYLFPE